MISERGLQLIREAEGLRLTAYPDPATGGEPFTIGYGRAHGVSPGDSCTLEEAEKMLLEDCAEAEGCIDAWVNVDLTENQKAALCSFIFNLGCRNFRTSTLLGLINAGNIEAASKQFMRWSKANGRVMAGLEKRRAAEAQLFTQVA